MTKAKVVADRLNHKIDFNIGHVFISMPISRSTTLTMAVQRHLGLLNIGTVTELLLASLVPRPHPAHVRRRSLVSQVQFLGLAPEV